MSSTTIRLASAEDVQSISNLVLRCLHEVNVKDYAPALIAEQSKSWTLAGTLARLRDRVTFVGVSGDEVLGVAGFDGKRARTVFVQPDWHGRGIGSALMHAVEALAHETGLAELELLSSITAQGFYTGLGYWAVREVFHAEERTILMRKSL